LMLSAIYILYSIGLLSREDDKTTKTITNTLIGVLVVIYILFVSITNMFFIKIEDYYVCYKFDEVNIEKIETHYYSYDDYYVNNYYIYLENDNAYIKNIDTNETRLLYQKIDRIFVVDGNIFLVSNAYSSSKVYYSDDLINYIELDAPVLSGGGYLIDVANNIKYPMVKGITEDLYIITDEKLVKIG